MNCDFTLQSLDTRILDERVLELERHTKVVRDQLTKTLRRTYANLKLYVSLSNASPF